MSEIKHVRYLQLREAKAAFRSQLSYRETDEKSFIAGYRAKAQKDEARIKLLEHRLAEKGEGL